MGLTVLVGLPHTVYSLALSHFSSMRRLLSAACSALDGHASHHQPGRTELPPHHHVDTELSADA